MSDSGKGGCLGAFWGCLTGVVLVAVVAGGLAYYYLPGMLKDTDKKILPWLESKGRVLLGRLALDPIRETIEQSDLSRQEKAEWKVFLDERWKEADTSRDTVLSREWLINQSRLVVFSLPGLYYSLLSINQQSLTSMSFNHSDAALARQLITDVTTGMEQGRYPVHAMSPLTNGICSVLTKVRMDTTDDKGRWIKDKNYRDFYRALAGIYGANKTNPVAAPVDMPEAFRAELKKFRTAVDDEVAANRKRAAEKGAPPASP